jgi:hypothetical protein
MELAGGATSNGTRIQLSTCNGSSTQRWTASRVTIHPVTTTVYVKNPQSGRCVAIGHNSPNGTQLQLWDCGGDGTYDTAWTLPR